MSPRMAVPAQMGSVTDNPFWIVWSDGHRSTYAWQRLRMACPCARCKGEWDSRPAPLTEQDVPATIRAIAGHVPVDRSVPLRSSQTVASPRTAPPIAQAIRQFLSQGLQARPSVRRSPFRGVHSAPPGSGNHGNEVPNPSMPFVPLPPAPVRFALTTQSFNTSIPKL